MNYRADHEPFAGATIKLLLEIYNGEKDKEKITNHLKIKDQILQLELEAAHYLYKIVPEIVTLFPDSKFILTVREPRSWLESEINKNYLSVDGKIWSKLELARYSRYKFDFESQKLMELKGVYPISSYLSYYIEHIDFILKNVPDERLLILDTYQLRSDVGKICDFVGVYKESLNLSKIHSSKRKEKPIKLREYVSENVLSKKIESICHVYINDNLPFLKEYI